MTKRQKKNLKRIIISLICFVIIFAIDLILKLGFKENFPQGLGSIIPNEKVGWLVPFVLFLAVYIYIGYDVLIKCGRNITRGQIFDENFLMVFATLGAFGLGIYNSLSGRDIEGFDEACAVLLFYQVGEWFQSYAVGKSRKSISSLMDIRPDFANVIRDEAVSTVSPEEVALDEIILVNPGEKIPLDGVIIEGNSSLDTKALTGESLPRDVSVGNEVISGTINLTSQLKVRVTKAFYDSTVSKILDLVENASNKKSKTENFITKFAKYYTPTVVISAIILAIVPSIITKQWDVWIYRALTFLVVSCPCALVISVPLSFFAGIGGASKYGILIKGSNHLEQFNRANIFVFDKTGTITKGNFVVTKVTPENKKDEILRYAAIAENNSSHPIAKSIVAAYGKEIDNSYVLTNVVGRGILAENKEHKILCGSGKLMKENNIEYIEEKDLGTIVYVAVDGQFTGSILIADEIKDESIEVIHALNDMGGKTIMLTGDSSAIAQSVATSVGFTKVKSELLPQNKVEELESIINEKNSNEVVCFVGDGINDAPVLMRSDIGIAMGGVGSDAAIEASDIVLMQDDLRGIPLAKKIAKKTMRIVYENIWFAIGVKVLILILSAFGITNMWFSIFGDVGVAVIAILNATRSSKIDNK